MSAPSVAWICFPLSPRLYKILSLIWVEIIITSCIKAAGRKLILWIKWKQRQAANFDAISIYTKLWCSLFLSALTSMQNMLDLIAPALIKPFITSSRKILFLLWPMVWGKLWPINHPSLSSLASLHASVLSSQRSLLPSRSILPRSKATTQSPASWFVALVLLGLWLAENSSRDGGAANKKQGAEWRELWGISYQESDYLVTFPRNLI